MVISGQKNLSSKKVFVSSDIISTNYDKRIKFSNKILPKLLKFYLTSMILFQITFIILFNFIKKNSIEK